MQDFITLLYNAKKENGTLIIEDDELQNWKDKLERVTKEMDTLVTEHLDEKYQARFNQLLLEMDETSTGIKDILKELYFRAGVIEGTKINKILNADDKT